MVEPDGAQEVAAATYVAEAGALLLSTEHPAADQQQPLKQPAHQSANAATEGEGSDINELAKGRGSAISYIERTCGAGLARQLAEGSGGGCGNVAGGVNAHESIAKKGSRREDEQMRRSHIEPQPQPETDKRLQSGSRRIVAVGERSDCLSRLNLDCRLIKSASEELDSGKTSHSQLQTTTTTTTTTTATTNINTAATTRKEDQDLTVDWLEERGDGLVKRAIRSSVDSRSLCIQTSLVRSSSPSPKRKSFPREVIDRTIKRFSDHFRRRIKLTNPEHHLQDQENGEDGENPHRREDINSRYKLPEVIEQHVGGDYAERRDFTTESATQRLLPVYQNQALSYSQCGGSKIRNFIQVSVSCNQMQETPQVSSCDELANIDLEVEDEETNRKPTSFTNRLRSTRITGKSSNIISTSQINMSESAQRGYVVKNKYIIEDKLRKQAAQRDRYSATTAAAGNAPLDDSQRTYCPVTGATDINYDSSSSSGNNCFEINNTCAMLGRCPQDGPSDNHDEFDDCRPPPGGIGCKISISNKKKNSSSPGLKKRENWDKNIEFLLAVIGFAVDLGNVWRFPYICYKNGGGAFLVPYTIMFILGGLPIFYLEMSLGQYFSSGCLTVWKRVCPMAKGIGYAMCVLNFFTGLYYNTIISWAVFFFVESFTQVLPWTSCNNPWNGPDCRTIDQRQAIRLDSGYLPMAPNISSAPKTNYSSPTKDYFEREVLQLHLSTGIDDLGSIRTPLAVYLAIVFICIYFAIWKGVKSTGKAVWITALLPYFVLIPLLIRGVFLEGAWLGIKYYLYPQWEKIIDVNVWVEAAKQIYFSLGPGFGTLMALSSYNKFNHDCCRDTLIAAAVNYFASFISGLVIFAVLGYMATIENVNINDVAREGPGLVFQVYPEGLATMRFSSMWSILFFIMVITLGIDSTFGGLESVITGLCDEYPRILRAHRSTFIGILIVLIYLCSLPTTTYGGNYVIYVLESYGTSLSLLFIVLIETIIVCWLYGAERFCKNLEEMHGRRPGAYWRICWKYISPTILLLIFIAACGQELDKYHTLKNDDYTYPKWAPTVGLLMTGSSVCCIPVYAIYYIKTKTSGSLLERLKIASRPIEGDLRDEKEIYVDALTDKIIEENKGHRDTVI